jgi:beta-lactamase regulating signal transducer with metallopeptidase domain
MPVSPFIDQLLAALWRASWQDSLLIVLVLLAQVVLRRRLSAGWRSTLWVLVIVRLSLPVTPSSQWSVFNLASRLDTQHPSTLDATEPTDAQTHRSAGLRHSEDHGYLWEMTPESFDDAVSHALSQTPWTQATDAALLPATQTTLGLREPADNFPRDWLPALFWIWLGGVAILGTRIVCGAALLSRCIRSGARVTDRAVLDLLEQSRELMGVHRSPALVETEAVDGPALFGLVRPRLLLPPGILGRLNDSELRHVFLHELAHLRRHDALLNWAAALLQTLHWFNPIVWFAMARMRLDRELACDALVLARTDGGEQRAYGATLLKLVSGLTGGQRVAGLVGIGEGSTHVKQRIRAIASFRRPGRVSIFAGMSILFLLAAISLTDARANRDAEGQDNERSESASEQVEKPVEPSAPPEMKPTLTTPPQAAGTTGGESTIDSKVSTLPGPNPIASTKLVHVGPGRLAIQSKLDRIILDEVQFEGMALLDVLNYLGTVAREHDPDQEGVNFLVNTNLADVMVRDTSVLRKIRLGDVLDAIARAGDRPIRYSVQEFAVHFTLAPPELVVELETRIYKVTPERFLDSIRASGLDVNEGESPADWVRALLAAAGVELQPPKQIYFNDRKGVLMVRATAPELEIIQKAIETFDVPADEENESPNGNERDPQVESRREGLQVDPWSVADIAGEPSRSEPAQASDIARHRQSVESRLRNIVIDELGFESVPLWKAVRQLEAESILQDLEGQGVRIYLDESLNALHFNNSVDPTTGRSESWFDLESIVIRIMPPIRKVRLGDVLDAMVRVADQPIQYAVAGRGIVFSRKPPEQVTRLETRIYRLEPKSFEESLRRIPTLPQLSVPEYEQTAALRGMTSTNVTEDFQVLFRKFVTATGVNTLPPNQIYFKPSKGLLMVRATTEELNNLQMALEVLGVPDTQVNLEVRAVELSRTESREMGFDWFLGNPTPPSVVNATVGSVMGILTERQFPVVLGALERRPDIRTQKVAVAQASSGQRVRIRWELADGTPLRLDCVPDVRTDNTGVGSLDLKLILVPGSGESETERAVEPGASANVLPSDDTIIRRAVVWSGQTVVLGNPPTVEPRPRPDTEASRKQLLVFVTATLLDSTSGGTRRSFDPDTIPPQH